ncbi:hypothetical protein WN55_07917, partial [Dufourea novaeangliae]
LGWLLGVDRNTLGHIIREEVKRDKLRVWLWKRAEKFDEKIRKGEVTPLVKECWIERKKSEEVGNWTRREKKREDCYRRCGYSEREVERIRNENKEAWRILVARDRVVQEQERMKSVWNSKYALRYKRGQEDWRSYGDKGMGLEWAKQLRQRRREKRKENVGES